MAAVILVVVIGLLLPVFKMGSAVGQSVALAPREARPSVEVAQSRCGWQALPRRQEGSSTNARRPCHAAHFPGCGAPRSHSWLCYRGGQVAHRTKTRSKGASLAVRSQAKEFERELRRTREGRPANCEAPAVDRCAVHQHGQRERDDSRRRRRDLLTLTLKGPGGRRGRRHSPSSAAQATRSGAGQKR